MQKDAFDRPRGTQYAAPAGMLESVQPGREPRVHAHVAAGIIPKDNKETARLVIVRKVGRAWRTASLREPMRTGQRRAGTGCAKPASAPCRDRLERTIREPQTLAAGIQNHRTGTLIGYGRKIAARPAGNQSLLHRPERLNGVIGRLPRRLGGHSMPAVKPISSC